MNDLTVPDRTSWSPGARFTRIWVLKSAGPSPWPEGSRLVFVEGARMGGPDEQEIEPLPAPGETVTVSVELVAPASEGEYEGLWQIQDADGIAISDELDVHVVVSRPPTPRPTYRPPELIGPEHVGCVFTFRWSWPRELAEDEYFALRLGIGDPGQSRWWGKETQYQCPLEEEGEYSWNVAICRGDPAAGVCEELAVSKVGVFSWGGCRPSKPRPKPTPS